MEQPTLTELILEDDNNKEKGLTSLLFQNPNGINLGHDRLTLREIIDSSIQYEIDILCLPKINTN